MKYKNYSIADLLDATVEELAGVENIRKFALSCKHSRMSVSAHIHLGKSSTTLSGAKPSALLARELSKRRPGAFYVDEPTTGLHFDDVRKLLAVLERLVM